MIKRLKTFLFTNTSDKQTVIKNTFWLMGSELLVRIIRFFLIIYIARILGTEGWGLFSYAFSFIGTALVFSDAGISTLFIKEYTNHQTRYIKAMVIIKFFLMVISGIIAIIAGVHFASLPIYAIVFPVIITLLLDSIREFITALLRSEEKMELEALIKTVTNIVLVAASLILLYMRATPVSLAFGYMIGSISGCIIALIATYPILKKLKTNYHKILYAKEDIKNVWGLIFPIALTGLATTAIANMDTMMLGAWKNATDVGLYASAQRIFQFTLIIPAIFVTALYPTLSKIYSENKKRFILIAKNCFSFLFILGTPLALGGFLIANDLMITIFGAEYLPAGNAFAWLILGVFLLFPGILFNTISVVTETQKRIAFYTLSTVVINAFLNILLIPRFGITGAAIAATITQLYLFILNGIFFKAICNVSNRDIRDIIIGTLLISSFIISTPAAGLAVHIFTSICIYFSILLILKNPSLKLITAILTKK